MYRLWRHFNEPYPSNQEVEARFRPLDAELLAVMGPDRYWAWFNRGWFDARDMAETQ
jgi:hypothetical protein